MNCSETFSRKGGLPMTRSDTRIALTLTGVLATLLASTLPLQSAFGEGGARRDVVRQEQQNIKDVIKHATEAVEHGEQGHAEKLVTHAETSLQHAMRGGLDPHVAEAMTNLKEAIEHGKAGHADVATKHAENAVTHLSQIK
jgi:predicted RNase H-like HicB family nuclease